MKFPAALFSKTSTLPKFSKLLVAYFPLLHNDEHHIESVGMFHLFPFQFCSSIFKFFYISGVMATCSNSKKYLVIAFQTSSGYDNYFAF
jgi:hypothetical protein